MESIEIECKYGTGVFNRPIHKNMSNFDRLVFESEHGDAKSGMRLIKILEAEISHLRCTHELSRDKGEIE
jgi:hypothetical protein